MPDFSVKIVPGAGNLATFQPDLPGSNPGDPLNAPPSALVSWNNHTGETHQVAMDDGTYTSNDILPSFSSKTDYIAPSTTGTVSYHCTKHEGETGQIAIQDVVPLPPVAVLLIALILGGLSGHLARAQNAGSHAGQKAQATPASQIQCLPAQQALLRIPEVVSKDGRLRATLVTGTEQVRMPMRYPLTFPTTPRPQVSQPGDPDTFQACFPEWVRTFRSPNVTTPYPPPVNGLNDPMPGPTLRARVGDFIELTFVNEIDPSKFGQSIDLGDVGACDSTSAGYPGHSGDTFPDCFHGSTTANIHFHGTHTNPTSTGDNVFLEILSSKRLIGGPAPVPPSFDKFFDQCEEELSKGSHVEWPVNWYDLPKAYTDMQKELLERFDKQPNSGKPLWPVNQEALDHHQWPQYYIGSYPYCFRLPKYPETTPAQAADKGAGSAEMQAHQGMESSAMLEQGGTLKMGQSPGTHWYHAHKHGSTSIDVSNGFIGALIIEGQYDDEINQVYKAYGPEWTRTQPVLVINQFGTSPNLKGGASQDKGPDFSVNGRTDPIISMKPGEVQMWRILNASGRAGAQFLAPPQGLHWKILARDGVQFYTDNYSSSTDQPFLLASGNRIDLLVQAECSNASGCVDPVLVENTVDPSDIQPKDTPHAGPFQIHLATVKVAGNPVNMPFPDASPAKTFPDDLKDIADGDIQGTQTVDFGTVPQQFNNGPPPHSMAAVHTINGKKFDGEVGVSVLLNKVEEWKISNNSTFISHPFHIHINPFQISENFSPNSTLPGTSIPRYVFDNTPVQPGQCSVNPLDPTTWKPCYQTEPATHRIWWDVFPIPSGHSVTLAADVCTELDKCPTAIQRYTACTTTNGASTCSVTIPGYFKMRSRFVDYPGWFVIHCHILAHEDRGMMTVVEVTPLIPPYSHH